MARKRPASARRRRAVRPRKNDRGPVSPNRQIAKSFCEALVIAALFALATAAVPAHADQSPLRSISHSGAM